MQGNVEVHGGRGELRDFEFTLEDQRCTEGRYSTDLQSLYDSYRFHLLNRFSLSRRMARECLPPGIWGISSWSCLELRNCGNAWWKAHPKNRPRTEISSPIPKDVTAQMHFWIFHIGHKFKLLTKQWAMRRESWRVVCNNISGEGEWDDSLRSTRVACVQRAQM